MNFSQLHTRRRLFELGAAIGAGALWPFAAQSTVEPKLITRKIPRTGEDMPVIGMGTQFVLDIGDDAEKRAVRIAVLRALFDAGARTIDTAPSYGPAEATLGSLLEEMKARDRAFVSTKFSRSGQEGAITEMRESLRRLRTNKIELMLRHNIGFVPTNEAADHLAVLREWKQQGICRYIGVTHSQNQAQANPRLIELLQKENLDFIQINYSMAQRSVEEKLLAVAAETGTAVMCNLPFARAALFKAVSGKQVPDWAREFDAVSWGQFFLKYLLGRKEVNLVIPGVDRVAHMIDNLDAGRGRLPNAAQRKRMVDFIGNL